MRPGPSTRRWHKVPFVPLAPSAIAAPTRFALPPHRAAILALALMLGACAGDLNPVRDVFVATGLGEAEREAPDFIAGTRPGELAYAPIRPIDPPLTEARTEEELAEMEEELRRLQERNAARAAQTRRMTLLPDPEPVIVEPLPDFEPAIEPASP